MINITGAIEIIQDRLVYASLTDQPHDSSEFHFFSIDKELIYWNYFYDFGPLNLGQFFRFCQKLNHKLSSTKYKDKMIIFFSSTDGEKRANAVTLICCWQVVFLKKTAQESYELFQGCAFPSFHDASSNLNCTYNLTVLDCIKGFEKAVFFNFFQYEAFDLHEYESLEQVENGDLNWLLYDKFIAFAGPQEKKIISEEGVILAPEDYIPYFKKKNITLVVRLNQKYYDEKKFTQQGIDHLELYYPDGTNPTNEVLQRFLSACEQTSGAVAVHCKAGLGRTGTCIGCYLMKHYRFSAAEAIGWMRICRPGCVIGPQQDYLKQMENQMWEEGEIYYSLNLIKFQHKIDINSTNEEEERQHKEQEYEQQNEDAEPLETLLRELRIENTNNANIDLSLLYGGDFPSFSNLSMNDNSDSLIFTFHNKSFDDNDENDDDEEEEGEEEFIFDINPTSKHYENEGIDPFSSTNSNKQITFFENDNKKTLTEFTQGDILRSQRRQQQHKSKSFQHY